MQYIQLRGLPFNPVDLFNQDLCKQVKEWRRRGKRVLIMMDINDHPLQNKFYTKLQEQNTELEEFTHECWGFNKPYTHHLGKTQIDSRYKTPEVKIVNLVMLTFAESPGDHQSFVLDVSTQSLLGVYRYKVCRLVSRRLVTSQEASVKRYNKNNSRAVPHPLHQRANKCGRQHDEILWVSVSTVVAFDDNKALQTDDRNKNPCGKELQKSSKATQQFQPHH
jgi:hypothetical protein